MRIFLSIFLLSTLFVSEPTISSEYSETERSNRIAAFVDEALALPSYSRETIETFLVRQNVYLREYSERIEPPDGAITRRDRDIFSFLMQFPDDADTKIVGECWERRGTAQRRLYQNLVKSNYADDINSGALPDDFGLALANLTRIRNCDVLLNFGDHMNFTEIIENIEKELHRRWGAEFFSKELFGGTVEVRALRSIVELSDDWLIAFTLREQPLKSMSIVKIFDPELL